MAKPRGGSILLQLGLLGSTSSIPHRCCSSTRGTRLVILTWPVSVRGCGLSSPHPPARLPRLLALTPACALLGTAAINYGNSCVIYMKSAGSAAPGMRGVFLVEPCCPLLQTPFCRRVFN